MTKFTIDITNKSQLAGITAAREAFNASLPNTEEVPREDHPDYIATDEAYFITRMQDVAKSYAKQHGYDTEELARKQAEVAEIEAKQAAKGI